MALALTGDLLLAAIVLGGLLAGSNVDRTALAMPAWRRLGPEDWAAFSRRADLGNGRILYPFEAIGSALLTVAAAISYHFDPVAPAAAALPLYGSVIASAAGLLLTVKAAPIMLGIRDTKDRDELQTAFDGFLFWGNLRGACQVLAFLAQVLAVALLAGSGS